VNLREDIARAARAAVWARAAIVWGDGFLDGLRDESLLESAKFLAHLRAGAVEVYGHIPKRRVHPWDCYLNDVDPFTYSHIHCRIHRHKFSLYLDGEVPKAAVDAALAELRSRARAAGTIVWVAGLIARPAPPNIVRIARDAVQVVRSKLNAIGPSTTGDSGELEVKLEPENAAALASVEVGNWFANVSLQRDNPYTPLDISNSVIFILVYDGRVEIDIDGIDKIWIYPTRPPRSMRSAFAAAYMKWYKRVAAAALVEALEGV
jgi:hypothetical protein